MAKTCSLCGIQIGFLDSLKDSAGNILCKKCYNKKNYKPRCKICGIIIEGPIKTVNFKNDAANYYFHPHCYETDLKKARKNIEYKINRFKPKTFDVLGKFFDKYANGFKDEDLADLLVYILDKEGLDVRDYIREEVEFFINTSKYVIDLRHKSKKFEADILGKNNDEKMTKNATLHAKALYYALKERGIESELEAFDGYKHIDLAIIDAKMYIEIDGSQHSIDPKQLEADINRDYHSHKDGFVTKRFTNEQIDKYLDEIADALAVVIKQRKK